MSEHGAPAEGVLTVFAAASLSDAFEAVGRRFEAAHPGERVTFNFAGSQQLAQQLAQGAPGDVFASADERQMAAVVLAQTFVASPFYLRSAILGFGAVEPELALSVILLALSFLVLIGVRGLLGRERE